MFRPTRAPYSPLIFVFRDTEWHAYVARYGELREGTLSIEIASNAAALELRPVGIHVALLIVDAGIQPLTGAPRAGISPEALADPHRIAEAVLFLANQDARAATHELQLTPLAENWTP